MQRQRCWQTQTQDQKDAGTQSRDGEQDQAYKTDEGKQTRAYQNAQPERRARRAETYAATEHRRDQTDKNWNSQVRPYLDIT